MAAVKDTHRGVTSSRSHAETHQDSLVFSPAGLEGPPHQTKKEKKNDTNNVQRSAMLGQEDIFHRKSCPFLVFSERNPLANQEIQATWRPVVKPHLHLGFLWMTSTSFSQAVFDLQQASQA